MIFLHTADWQLGKPFAGVADPQKRALLQDARIQAIHRIAEEAKVHGAEFVVVSGDLFDSTTPTNATVAAACQAVGAIGVPVFAIPGNHDHGGPGSVWYQPFFQRECQQLSPNLHVLLTSDPVVYSEAVLFPCPLLRRHEAADPTACLRNTAAIDRFGSKVRIVLAHGTTVMFGSSFDDEEDFSGDAVNAIDLLRLREDDFDYVALGDWHGSRQITNKAWYSGTPEPDRFPKGSDHAQGYVLRVEAGRKQLPRVQQVPIGTTTWSEVSFAFSEGRDADALAREIEGVLGTTGGKALLHLRLGGALGIEESRALDELLESWQARLIRLKVENATALAPTAGELDSLAARTDDPLVARVATRLAQCLATGGSDAITARLALRELYLATSAA